MFKAPRYQQLAHAHRLFYLALGIMINAGEFKPVLFIVANFCHFAKKNKNGPATSTMDFFGNMCDQNSPDFKKIKLKRTRFLP